MSPPALTRRALLRRSAGGASALAAAAALAPHLLPARAAKDGEAITVDILHWAA